MNGRFSALACAAALGLALVSGGALAADKFIVVQSTTSTQNSGLLDELLPKYTAKSGTEVRVVAVGTGQAIKNAANCDGDVLLVHAKPAEEKFVAEGGGVKRFDLMHNDFVIIGPESDPAGVAGMTDAEAALKKIAAAKAPFASRGDESGTHQKERSLWKAAGVDVKAASGDWYRETGSGMGETINTGVGMGAYVLTDRATWSAHKNRAGYKILVEGDKDLFNQYGVILVNPAKCPNVKADLGQDFIDWLLSKEGQDAIAAFRINGEQQFFPDAQKSAS
ncbi:substrate-binding domain-containing protein [Propylenella binzhouense]|uniref:Sulfate transporter n=1 Tax=Propylenella binzhouense TaxID=2555902 RepID=A0A964T5S4_9HYPH|nr:substrate-binding domain-containing protein [Propylenella binzhouense]MYZ49046.1 sulfate transporter [Propylenella binzhouense]